MAKPMNGEIAEKAIGVFQKVQYYTEPSIIPIGVTEGLKVYKTVMKSCVIYLN